MELKDMRVGQRVRLRETMDIFHLGTFSAGLTGTVTDVEHDAKPTEPVARVRLDAHHPDLEEWDNELELTRIDDFCGEITPEAFDLLEG